MKIEFKAVTRRVNLGEYDGSLDGGTIDVWVNVPRELMAEMRGVSAETTHVEMVGMLGRVWNPPGIKSAEPWPEEDIQALYEHCAEQDPMLWRWVTKSTWNLVMEYQGLKKKN